jgi:hypothetical protein
MDFQNRAGNKAGGGGVAGFSVKLNHIKIYKSN